MFLARQFVSFVKLVLRMISISSLDVLKQILVGGQQGCTLLLNPVYIPLLILSHLFLICVVNRLRRWPKDLLL